MGAEVSRVPGSRLPRCDVCGFTNDAKNIQQVDLITRKQYPLYLNPDPLVPPEEEEYKFSFSWCKKHRRHGYREPHPALEFSFDPCEEEEMRRSKWYGDQLLDQSTPSRPNIQRRRAAARSAATLRNHQPNCFLVSGIHPIYIKYTMYEGQRYVADICNDHYSPDQILAYEPKPTNGVTCLYIAENHLGIVDIIFAPGDCPPTPQQTPNVFWRTLLSAGQDEQLLTEFDGVKLRAVGVMDRNREWCGPMPLALDIPLALGVFPDVRTFNGKLGATRMKGLQLNDPSVVGYAFVWDFHCIGMYVDRGSHEAKTKWCNSLCEPSGKKYVWDYFPMNPGENIREIWYLEHEGVRVMCLTFVTNFHRKIRIGPQHLSENRSMEWILFKVYTFDEVKTQPQYMYHGPAAIDLRDLAFAGTRSSPDPDTSLLIPPKLPPPPIAWASPTDYVWCSEALMSGIVSVTPSVRKRINTSKRTITGFLFGYRDGTKTTIGQVNPDWLDETTDVSNHTKMRLAFKEVDGHYQVVTYTLQRSPRSNCTGITTLLVPFKGQLTWWYSRESCWVDHSEFPLPGSRSRKNERTVIQPGPHGFHTFR